MATQVGEMLRPIVEQLKETTGQTQGQIAERLGMSGTQFSGILTGHSNSRPNEATLELIAKGLGLSDEERRELLQRGEADRKAWRRGRREAREKLDPFPAALRACCQACGAPRTGTNG